MNRMISFAWIETLMQAPLVDSKQSTVEFMHGESKIIFYPDSNTYMVPDKCRYGTGIPGLCISLIEGYEF